MKERHSLSHNTLERLLQLRCDENYEHAIELFLHKYPDGTVRKRSRHIDGHVYTKKQRRNDDAATSAETMNQLLTVGSIENIPLSDISDNEWTDSDEDY